MFLILPVIINMDSQVPTAKDIVDAYSRIQPYVHRTPVIHSQSANGILGCQLYLKCENLQKVGAYKARGATNKLLQLLKAKPHLKGVCTHSSGNHGQALAYISHILKVPCYVVMPQNSPEVKRAAVKGYNSHVVDSGNTQK
jgi:threonine dehydratase